MVTAQIVGMLRQLVHIATTVLLGVQNSTTNIFTLSAISRHQRDQLRVYNLFPVKSTVVVEVYSISNVTMYMAEVAYGVQCCLFGVQCCLFGVQCCLEYSVVG